MQLPPLSEILDSMRVVQLRLKTRFRDVDVREVVLFEGPSGWGEFAPFKDHTLEHSANWLAAAIEAAYLPYPLAQRDEVRVNAIVPMLATDAVEQWVLGVWESTGATTYKVKCGSPDFRDDVSRLDELIYTLDHQVSPEAKIRIDINGAWSVDQAVERIREISDMCGSRLEYVEQPVSSLADCAVIRERIPVKIAIDEGVRLLADARLHVSALQAAGDIAILKAIPLGGVARALDIASMLEMPCVVSGSMDSSVGLTQGIALAAALPELEYACGFSTGSLLAEDVVTTTLIPHDGTIAVGRIAPDEALLAGLASRVDSATKNYWRERVIACYEVLETA